MVIYRCNNCLWEGTPVDMDADGDFFLCPNCIAPFYPGDTEHSLWEVVEVVDDPEDEDYGEFPDYESPY